MKCGLKSYALVALTVLMAPAASIFADTVTLNWASGTNPTPSATVGTNLYDGSAGLMKFVVSSTTAPVDNTPTGDNPFVGMGGQTIGTYCIDATHGLSSPDTYTLHLLAGDTINGDNGNVLLHFFAAYAGSVGSDGTKAAAFQTAIWEIIYDHDSNPWAYTAGTGSSASLKNGNFKFDSGYVGGSVYSQADTWLGGSFLTSDTTGWKVLELDATTPYPSSGQSQIYGYYTPGGTPNIPVPVPAAAWLGLGMLGAMAGVRTLRRRSQR